MITCGSTEDFCMINCGSTEDPCMITRGSTGGSFYDYSWFYWRILV